MKKYALYILIVFIALVGLFSSAEKASAVEDPNALGSCQMKVVSAIFTILYEKAYPTTKADCPAKVAAEEQIAKNNPDFRQYHAITAVFLDWVPTPDPKESGGPATKSDFEKYIIEQGCGFFKESSFFPGCILTLSYWLFYVLPSAILWLAANFFNVIIALTLSSKFFSDSTFIPAAWGVVRDLSNIFFILILLYIAIKIILDMAGHEAKQMIAKVVVVALLINFSLFFTQVVIDTSNVLALIFYNKLQVNDANGNPRPYTSLNGERDVAGGMVNAFDPTRLLTAEFFKQAGTTEINGVKAQNTVSEGMVIFITILTGVIMLFAAYCLFVTGFSFVGRMIELFMLLIFSPFAFMSSTVPALSHFEDLGWDSWFKRLIKASFMASIFMFFLYFIFLLIGSKIFDSLITMTNSGMLVRMLGILIPALLILTLLLKATKFAEKGAGGTADFLASVGKGVAGLAIGGAVGVGASTLQGSLGRAGKAVYESKYLTDKEAKGSLWAKTLRTVGGGAANSSFDLRKGVAGAGLGLVSKATGFNLGQNSKILTGNASYEDDLKKRDEKRKKRAEGLKVKEGEEETQTLHRHEEEHQRLSLDNAHDVHEVEHKMTDAEDKIKTRKQDVDSHVNKEKDKVTGEPLDPEYKRKLEAYDEAVREYNKLKTEKGDITGGGAGKINPKTKEVEYRTHNKMISETTVKNAEKAEKEAIDKTTKTMAAINELDAKAAIAKRGVESAEVVLATAAKKSADATAKSMAQSTNLALAAAAEEAKIAEKEAVEKVAAAKKTAADIATTTTKAIADFKKATAEADKAIDNANTARAAKEKAISSGKGLGRSQSEYETKVLPHDKEAIKRVNDIRTWNFAADLQNEFWSLPWREAERRKSAHDIRMGVKAESHSKGGHGHGGLDNILDDVIGGAIVNAFSDHGHDKGSDAASAPAGDHGGH